MKGNSKGVALMMVLWVLLLLIFIAMEFAHSMRMEMEITKNLRDEIQAYYLARAGIELARYELAICGGLNPHYRDPKTQRLVFGKAEDGKGKESPKFRVHDLGEGIFEYDFEAAGDKYSLNKLATNETALKKFLEKYCGMDAFSEEISQIALSIMDWVDSDDTYRLPGIGAEDDWYESNDQGYQCKDAPFDSEDELAMIRGFRIEKEDSEDEIAQKKKMLGTFKKYFMVNTSLENAGIGKAKEKSGQEKDIFLNTAGPEVIEMAYEIGLISRLPEDIAKTREENRGIVDEFAPGYYYIISAGVVNSSPVHRSIKVSLLRDKRDTTYWKPLDWNDNYIPEYSDSNQTDDQSDGDDQGINMSQE